MEITSVEILKKLPEFDDLLRLADEIAQATVIKLSIERDIKAKEAEITLEALSNQAYYQGGKPPSMSFISSTYIYTGFSGDVLPLRESHAKAVAEEARLKARLDLFKEFLGMWRSLNASERIISV